MSKQLLAQVAGALTNVRNPRVDNDVLSAGMVQDLTVGDGGRVSFTFVLGRDDPATLVREARRAVRDVAGVNDVRIDVVEPQSAAAPQGSAPATPPRPPREPRRPRRLPGFPGWAPWSRSPAGRAASGNPRSRPIWRRRWPARANGWGSWTPTCTARTSRGCLACTSGRWCKVDESSRSSSTA